MNWQDLLRATRQRESTSKIPEEKDLRNAFEKDYHRIVQSASFRRLQDKTQVFPLDPSDFVRTRLTHSLEVSSLAKSLGQLVCRKIMKLPNLPLAYQLSHEQMVEISDLLLCAGLIHDIGNTPFGHYGEDTIRLWFAENMDVLLYKDRPLSSWLNEQMKADFLHFEGNAQALRVLTKLHFLVDEYGMNLTFPLLHVLVKYPIRSLDIGLVNGDIHYKKMGYFYAERELFSQMTKTLGTSFQKKNNHPQGLYSDGNNQLGLFPENGTAGVCRHPLTFLLEASDDIAYATADIEDGYKKGKISYSELNFYLQNELKSIKNQPTKHLFLKQWQRVLQDKYAHALKAKYENPEYYSIQNALIYAQTLLLEEASEVFVKNYELIMRGEYKRSLLDDSLKGSTLIYFLKNLAVKKVFGTAEIVKMQFLANSIIRGLLNEFVPAVLEYGSINDNLSKSVHLRLMDIISDNFKQCYLRESKGKDEAEDLYLRLLLVTDYISGMTDSFAKGIFMDLQGRT